MAKTKKTVKPEKKTQSKNDKIQLKITTLKVKSSDIFMAREKAQGDIVEINQAISKLNDQLVMLHNQISELEKKIKK